MKRIVGHFMREIDQQLVGKPELVLVCQTQLRALPYRDSVFLVPEEVDAELQKGVDVAAEVGDEPAMEAYSLEELLL